MNTEPQRRIIRLPEVSKLVGLGKTAIYERVKDHSFPAPIKLGRASGWIEAEVQKWVETQITASRGDH
ncbi:AlpA family transcriptional regulator [Cupriavidus sp. CV2]|uniref:helix-turn-helix transcriptional regulator n=1 Tax=Cupriavidus ulmosensis TaxID=3065913 RepID=UPI00296AAFD8|nr:AlpA family transcriptional regulator [Cupriavidus sp. CV2]MDW3683348.1 AlpA family transcriptional regulator [Cupriavidus sp. CV2]